jgi:hypothetical protein
MSEPHGFVASTPESIFFTRLLALRGAVKLEMRGMKRRGRSASVVAKELLGISKSARRKKVLEKLDEAIEQMKAEHRGELQEGDTE